METVFTEHLDRYDFPYGKKCLLAVSGGIDSMVMCDLFLKSEIPFAIAHCNFKLRGKDSDADEKFVKKYAEKHGILFHSIRFDSLKESAGIQENARRLIYEYLEKIRKENKYSLICTAHHSDDSVETFLFHMIRGTGISGLKGIPVRQAFVFRPLLCYSRSEIERIAKANKINHRTDRSNAELKYTRNKIRNQVLPLLEKIQPGCKKNILLTMENISGAEQVYKDTVWSLFNEITILKNESVQIHKSKWLEAEHREILLYEYLSVFGFNASQVAEISRSVHSQPGKMFRSLTHMLLNDRTHFILSPLRKELPEEEVLIHEEYSGISSPISLRFTRKKPAKRTSKNALLNKETLKFPLVLRKWRPGDYFYPSGMNGRKKLSDLLTDLKIPRTEKQDIFVLTSGEQILWVVGHRIDRRFAANEHTTEYFCIDLK